MRIELGKKHNIRVTCVQPGAVDTELYDQISDPAVRQQMEDLKTQMEFLKAEDIAETVLFALQSPRHMDIAEVFVMPSPGLVIGGSASCPAELPSACFLSSGYRAVCLPCSRHSVWINRLILRLLRQPSTEARLMKMSAVQSLP